MRKGYVDTQEGQIHYRSAGSGDPVLLLHQTPTSSTEYEYVLPILARDFTAIALDTLGYGSSDRPPRVFEIPDYVTSIVHFLDKLGIDAVFVVGHHTGADLGVRLAASFPERVRKLVLSGFSARTNRKELTKEWLASPTFNYEPIDAEGDFLKKKWQLYRSFCGPDADPNVWYWPFLNGLMAGTGVHDGHQAAFRYDVEADLVRVKCPTLVLRGTNDMFMIELDYTLSLLVDGRADEIGGGGVFLPREMPDAFASRVRGFLLG